MSKIITFEEYKKQLNEDFHNPFEIDDESVTKKTGLVSDKGGYLKKRKPTFNPSRIEWSKRPGGDFTVISKTHFARGEIVEVCPVIILEELAKTVTGLKDIIFEIDRKKGEWGVVLGYGSLYRHSDKPNCEYAYNKGSKQMFFITKRTIKVGEELTIHYGKDYWNERMNFNLIGDEGRSDQNQGMPTQSDKTEESEVQPNKADTQDKNFIKQISDPRNPHNPVKSGRAIRGMGQQ